MTVTIGRASLNDLYDLSVRGRRVSFRVDIEGSDIYGMQALRQQLAGLVDNRDEEVVPFTWSEDSSLDGFYRVVSVDVPSADTMLVNGYIPEVTVELEAIGGNAAVPWVEIMGTYVVRTNSHSITTADPTVLLPYAATLQAVKILGSSGGNLAQSGPQTTETGDLVTYQLSTSYGSQFTAGFAVAPADAYDGAVKLEVDLNGTWYPLVGRNIGMVAGNDLRLNNGIVRVTFHTDHKITMERWYGGSWLTAKEFKLRSAGGYVFAQTGYWVVLRNSPECCIIKTSCMADTLNDIPFGVTFSMTRGRCFVEAAMENLYFVSPTGANATQMVACHESTTACSSVTAGIERTTADANSMHTGLLTPHSISATDLTNGTMTLATPAANKSYSVAMYYRRSGGSFEDHPTLVRENYIAGGSIRQRVVLR